MTGIAGNQLAYFVGVAEAGGISRAARTLYIAQPALSQAIQRLEGQLGVRLLTRHARGVTLTLEGEVLFEKAKANLAAEADAIATAQSLARASRGTLAVGFLGVPPPLIAPDALRAFADAYPDVDIAFRELRFPSSRPAEWLASVDVAICHGPPRDERVKCVPLWEEPRGMLLPAEHRLARRRALRVADVLDERFPSCDPSVDPSWMSWWTLDDLRGRPPPNLASDAPTNSLELVAALAAGRAICSLPLAAARTISDLAPQLVARELPDAAPVACSVVWCPPSHNPLASAFVEAVARAAGARTGPRRPA